MRLRNVYGCEASLFTWECVSSFDGEIPPEKQEALFRAEFPDVCGKVVFREMVAFNDAEGRRHRYLVIFPREKMPEHFARMLPRMAFLYGYADKLMRIREGYGNFRVAFLNEKMLYILVFWEGRLCHWAEETLEIDERLMGNVESQVSCRIERFDEFLKQDGLFSRVKEFQKELIRLDDDGYALKWESCFGWAVGDPFWKGMNLGENRPWHESYKWTFFVVALILCVATCGWNFMEEDAFAQGVDDVVPPELTAYPHLEESLEVREDVAFDKPINPTHSQKITGGLDCNVIRLKLQGIVAGRIVQLNVDGVRLWARLGETLENFRVEAIGRDRVLLGCGGDRYEIRAKGI